jgi:hypothetical protein
MLALEDRPFLRFFSFFALCPDADTCLNSVRPRPAASSLTANASPRFRDDNRYSSARLSLLSLPNKAASPREDRLSPTKAHTMNTLTNDASKPFGMRTYARIGGGGRARLISSRKSGQPSKSRRMIFLHKQRNNCFGMISFRKNGGWGCPKELLENPGSVSQVARRQCVRGSGMARTPAPPAPPAGSAVSAPWQIGRTSRRGPLHR